MSLTEEELLNVEGGGLKISMGASLIIGGIITFIVGAVAGFVNKTTCALKR